MKYGQNETETGENSEGPWRWGTRASRPRCTSINSTKIPHQYTIMKSRATTPYKSLVDLLRLRLQFFHHPQNPSTLRSAVNTVAVLRTRGPLPHAVEATAWLVSAQLSDKNKMETFLLRCAYAMALVRFVNGMLDPFQQGAHAVALLTIAKSIGLSLSFVDLRHSATHGPLPSLELLRSLAEKALDWLHDHYWELLLDNGLDCVEDVREEVKTPNILVSLKVYKKFRKQNLDIVPTGKVLSCLDTLVQISEDHFKCTQLAEYLVGENFIVKESVKFKTAMKIYAPIFENGLRALLLAVIIGLIHHCSSLSEVTYSAGMLERAQNWAAYLIPQVLASDFPICKTPYGSLEKAELEQVLRTALGLVPESPISRTVEDAISHKPRKFFLPPLLDEILGSPTVSSKEPSSEPVAEHSTIAQPEAKRRKRPILFHPHSAWTLSPFGVC